MNHDDERCMVNVFWMVEQTLFVSRSLPVVVGLCRKLSPFFTPCFRFFPAWQPPPSKTKRPTVGLDGTTPNERETRTEGQSYREEEIYTYEQGAAKKLTLSYVTAFLITDIFFERKCQATCHKYVV